MVFLEAHRNLTLLEVRASCRVTKVDVSIGISKERALRHPKVSRLKLAKRWDLWRSMCERTRVLNFFRHEQHVFLPLSFPDPDIASSVT